MTPDAFDKIVLVGGTTRIPLVRRRVAEFFGREPETEIDPDQAVALGAALQAMAMKDVAARPPVRSMGPPPPWGGRCSGTCGGSPRDRRPYGTSPRRRSLPDRDAFARRFGPSPSSWRCSRRSASRAGCGCSGYDHDERLATQC